jgi:hypothetical protein
MWGDDTMKGTRSLLIVLCVLVAIVAVWQLSDRRGAPGYLFPDLRSGSAHRVSIKAQGREEVVVARSGDIWFVVSEDSLPAEPDAVQVILERAASFSKKDKISSNPDKQTLFEVDTTGIRVAIENDRGESLASFVVGKVGPDYQSTYVREASSDDVILAAGYLGPMFDRRGRTWQDKQIYSLDPSQIVEITLTRPEERTVLKPGLDGQWSITQPESAACDQVSVSRLVRAITDLRTEGFGGRMPVADSGLERPDSSVSFGLANGGQGKLLFGHKNEEGRIYTMRGDSEVIYLLNSQKLNVLFPKLADLRHEEEPDKEQ